jgi:hypothetical protein
VDLGRVNVLQKDATTPVAKGQTLSVNAGDALSTAVTKSAGVDDFDKWVSGRVDAFVGGTNATLEYGSGTYNAGFDDLYTYGSWFPVVGYGYGWRPYGAGFGWSPFNDGCWFFDPIFGWSFAGFQPWGWLPYHYGSWLFQPGFGWVWIPGAFGIGGPVLWRPVTATWVRSKGGIVGVVPIHPLDAKGKAPLNMSQGILEAKGTRLGAPLQAASGEQWKVLKSAPKQALTNTLTASAAPALVSRNMFTGASGVRGSMVARGPALAFDPETRRFVNGAPAARNGAAIGSQMANGTTRNANARVVNGAKGNQTATARVNMPAKGMTTPPSSRISTPPAPRGGAPGGFAGGRSSSGSGGSFGGRTSGGGGGGGSASHPSGGGTSGGGRPH